jgi:hypothetical protein
MKEKEQMLRKIRCKFPRKRESVEKEKVSLIRKKFLNKEIPAFVGMGE